MLFAREGADIAIVYLNEDEDVETTRLGVADEGRRCILISGDIADAAFCREVVNRTPLNPANKSAEDVSQFGAQTPMKRPAQPEEIDPAFVFLASPHCYSNITGEVLPIIGGYSEG